MADLAPTLRQRFLDSNGDPLSGGKLHTYAAGTTSNKATYTDQAATSPNTNPIILDSDGYCDLWLGSGLFKFVLKDSSDNTLWTIDNVAAPSTASSTVTFSPTEQAITDGQSAADVTGFSYDGTVVSSVTFNTEIIRGTTVVANLRFSMQYVNGTWRVVTGTSISNELHGLTFSVNQVSTTGQLQVAADSGAGSGTLKIYAEVSFAA